jgi:hypothetical protein
VPPSVFAKICCWHLTFLPLSPLLPARPALPFLSCLGCLPFSLFRSTPCFSLAHMAHSVSACIFSFSRPTQSQPVSYPLPQPPPSDKPLNLKFKVGNACIWWSQFMSSPYHPSRRDPTRDSIIIQGGRQAHVVASRSLALSPFSFFFIKSKTLVNESYDLAPVRPCSSASTRWSPPRPRPCLVALRATSAGSDLALPPPNQIKSPTTPARPPRPSRLRFRPPRRAPLLLSSP